MSEPDVLDHTAAPFAYPGSNGEAVVLIHGFTGVPGHLRPLGELLHQAGFTVVAPRLAGHGASIDDLAGAGAEDWIESARRGADSVADHRRLHLVGLSMGGLIAILLAGPTAGATITTINSPIRFRDRRILLTPFLHRVRPVVWWPEEDTPRIDPEVADLWVTYPGFPTAAAAELLRLSRRARRAARRLRRPSLVIQSRADQMVHPSSGVVLARALGPGCRLMWLEDSIHNALLDRDRHLVHRAVLERVSTG